MHCGRCRKPALESHRYCPNCGRFLAPAPPTIEFRGSHMRIWSSAGLPGHRRRRMRSRRPVQAAVAFGAVGALSLALAVFIVTVFAAPNRVLSAQSAADSDPDYVPALTYVNESRTISASLDFDPPRLRRCPYYLPAGTTASSLRPTLIPQLVGSDGHLVTSAVPENTGNVSWDADLTFDNNSNDSCITSALVQFDLDRNGLMSREWHTVAFDPILGPDDRNKTEARLKVTSKGEGEDVVLSSWRIVSVSGFKPR